MKNRTLASLFIFFQLIAANANAGGSFFEQSNQYKGFYWFERGQSTNPNKAEIDYQIPSATVAAASIEARKKKLDDARNQMVAVGFDQDAPLSAKRQAVINYKKIEMEMWNGALSLVDASDMANFINPEIADNQNHPTNVFGVKLQRQVEAEQNIVAIIGFAKEFDLLLFADESCRYCREFAPVLKRFVNQHHFQLDIASLDSKAGNIAKSLGITSIPTLVAVKKDGFLLFEVSRGVVSTSELEANILLASKYSQELAVKKKQGDQGKRKQHKSRGYSG
jgi:conjugal transfer pilus assembly protein TraF